MSFNTVNTRTVRFQLHTFTELRYHLAFSSLFCQSLQMILSRLQLFSLFTKCYLPNYMLISDNSPPTTNPSYPLFHTCSPPPNPIPS